MSVLRFRAWHKGKMFHEEHNLERFFALYYGIGRDETAIMQSTGLKDKNGVEIYESDILQEEPGEDKWIVKWGTFWCYEDETIGWRLERRKGKTLGFNEEHCGDMEIIGNIYENPELPE